jgi:hypothetical protein
MELAPRMKSFLTGTKALAWCFVGPRSALLLWSQVSAIRVCPEPDWSTLHTHPMFLKFYLYIIIIIYSVALQFL